MWVIRAEQMKAFIPVLRREFQVRLKAFLTQRLQDEGIDFAPEHLDNVIEIGLIQAESNGFRTESEAARFIEIVCLQLGGFDDWPLPRQARQILDAH